MALYATCGLYPQLEFSIQQFRAASVTSNLNSYFFWIVSAVVVERCQWETSAGYNGIRTLHPLYHELRMHLAGNQAKGQNNELKGFE
jgi:hypothetical protein